MHGMTWIEIPEIGFNILCGCPVDSVKHLMKRGLIHELTTENGQTYETGPTAILLSDVMLQNGSFSNMSEFPIMQMLYRQGMIIPDHPGNTGMKPILVGSKEQVQNQLQYIYRGNYGLISKEEILHTGISDEDADDMMRMKLKFAFGKINHPDNLIDTCIVEEKEVSIYKGVKIKRIHPNEFEIQYKKEKVTVNLNLGSGNNYAMPYELNFHKVDREYFSIIHSGEGDGWDVNRPSMSSIIMYQGKVFLIDAGPNIDYTLNCLGISLNEVYAIFHTHSHDDHFAGLTMLMRTDRRIKYIATPLVRKSVTFKLAALLSIEQADFNHYFDIVDLEYDQWNDIEGLEVKPIYSPHPVETSVFNFRVKWNDGYKSYAHLADIIDLNVLKGILSFDDDSGRDQLLFDKVNRDYLRYSNVKKLDIGGGMIHGNAEDFKGDQSDKIILAHTSKKLDHTQQAIGSGAPFGTMDRLITTNQDYLITYASRYLTTYFPEVPWSEIQSLLNCPIVTFNPETIMLKQDTVNQHVYLVLTGNVDSLHADEKVRHRLTAGAFLGELSGITNIELEETYRAVSFVKALKIPGSHYYHFINKNNLYSEMENLQDRREFLMRSWLFGESISTPVLNSIAREMEIVEIEKGHVLMQDYSGFILLLESGEIDLVLDDEVQRSLKEGDFIGGETAIFNFPQCFSILAKTSSVMYKLPAYLLNNIPIVRFKMHEVYEFKTSQLVNSKMAKNFTVWDQMKQVNVHQLDQSYRKLYTICCLIVDAYRDKYMNRVLPDYFKMLYSLVSKTYAMEETLMEMYDYPGRQEHAVDHHLRLEGLTDIIFKEKKWKSLKELKEFLIDWNFTHRNKFDVKLGDFLNKKGLY